MQLIVILVLEVLQHYVLLVDLNISENQMLLQLIPVQHVILDVMSVLMVQLLLIAWHVITLPLKLVMVTEFKIELQLEVINLMPMELLLLRQIILRFLLLLLSTIQLYHVIGMPVLSQVNAIKVVQLSLFLLVVHNA